MNVESFVQNIKYYCAQKGVKPTNACKESGVGGSFINDIERGRTPSVSKVQSSPNLCVNCFRHNMQEAA